MPPYEDNGKYISPYLKEEYDPQIYINKIVDVINDARKNGLRVDFEDGILEIENTVSKDEKIIDFNEEINGEIFIRLV